MPTKQKAKEQIYEAKYTVPTGEVKDVLAYLNEETSTMVDLFEKGKDEGDDQERLEGDDELIDAVDLLDGTLTIEYRRFPRPGEETRTATITFRANVSDWEVKVPVFGPRPFDLGGGRYYEADDWGLAKQ